jgi:hypothetical protein
MSLSAILLHQAIGTAHHHCRRLDELLAELRDSLERGCQGTRREAEQVLRDIDALVGDLAETAGEWEADLEEVEDEEAALDDADEGELASANDP